MITEVDRQTLLATAEAIAPGWERRRPFVETAATPVRAWMLRELAPRPGETLLELAAGAGDSGFEAARLVGETGRLICSDFSPAMLDVARRRGAQLGVENVEYRVLEAERIELETDSVDGVLCRFGYMLMGDPARALAETRRVLRPGGRLALAVWGPPERNPFFAIVAMALVERGHLPPPQPTEPGIFSLAAEQRTRTLLQAAGFTTVRTQDVPVRLAVADVDEYLSVIADTAGPIAMVLHQLPEAERDAIRSRLDRAVAAFAAEGGGCDLPGVALAAFAS